MRPVPLTQPLAVIARDHDNGVVEVVFGPQRLEQLLDDAIGLEDLVVIAIRLVQALEKIGRAHV